MGSGLGAFSAPGMKSKIGQRESDGHKHNSGRICSGRRHETPLKAPREIQDDNGTTSDTRPTRVTTSSSSSSFSSASSES
jgi:hypothetical protein